MPLQRFRSWLRSPFVPREKKGQKRRTHATEESSYNKPQETAEINFDSTQLTFQACMAISGLSHELVCDRQVKFENRRSIHNSDEVVELLKDELLKSDARSFFQFY